MARHAVTRPGINVDGAIKTACDLASRIVRRRWSQIEIIAQALLERKHLDYEDVLRLLRVR